MEKKRYAIVPVDLFRDMFWERGMKLVNDLTLAGSDPEKVTAALSAINAYNEVRAQVEYIDK